MNFKISNIKCNNLHSILKPQQKKDNQIFFALLIIINKIEQDIIFGIGLNPSFFSKISTIIKGISFSELQSSFIEMYIFEIQNIKSFQVSNESVKTKKYLDFLCKKAKFYSGIKIDLLSVLIGSENYDFSLVNISNTKDNRVYHNYSRISFKVKCEEIKEYIIKINDINISYANDNNITNIPDDMQLQIYMNNLNNSIQSNVITFNHIKHNKSLLSLNNNNNELILTTSTITIEELFNSTITLHGYVNNDNLQTCLYFSLTKYKEQLLYILCGRYIEYANSIMNKSITDNKLNTNGTIEIKDALLNIGHKIDCKLTAVLSIENCFSFIQLKNVYFTEKGIINDPCYLYYEMLLISNNNNYNKDVYYDIQYQKLIKVYEELESITVYTKGNSISKHTTDLRENITKSADKEHYIYKYQNNDQLIIIANMYVKIISELIRIIVLYKEDLQNVVFILDIIRSILQREEFNLTLLNEIQLHYPNKKYDFSFISNLFNECISLNTIVQNILTNTTIFNLVEIFSTLFYKHNQLQQYILNAFQKDLPLLSNELNSINNYYTLLTKHSSHLTELIIDKAHIDNLASFTNLSKRDCLFINITKSILQSFQSSSSFPFTSLTTSPLNTLTNIFISYLSHDKTSLSAYSYYVNEVVSFYLTEATALNVIIHTIVSKTNAYDARSVYVLLDFMHQVIVNNFLKNTKSQSKVDFTLLQLITNGVIAVDSALGINKVLWLYYNDSHLMDDVHVKWFVWNIVKKYFFMFVFHWSWRIRCVFNKLVVFIINHRLKGYEVGRAVSEEVAVLNRGNEEEIQKELNIVKEKYGCNTFCMVEQGIKEYKLVVKEYEKWVEGNMTTKVEDYPMLIINLPKEEDIA